MTLMEVIVAIAIAVLITATASVGVLSAIRMITNSNRQKACTNHVQNIVALYESNPLLGDNTETPEVELTLLTDYGYTVTQTTVDGSRATCIPFDQSFAPVNTVADAHYLLKIEYASEAVSGGTKYSLLLTAYHTDGTVFYALTPAMEVIV